MNPFKQQCVALAAAALGRPEAEIAAMVATPPTLAQGDYAIPCFTFAKALRKPPAAIATEVAAKIVPTGLVTAVAAAGPYLNFTIDRAAERAAVVSEVRAQGIRYGATDTGGGRKVVIDYSSPNIAKPFHIGHMRSTIIGGALYRIHAHRGYAPVGINHLGDWGTQFGHLMAAFELWGEEAKLDQPDAIKHLLELYVRFNREGKAVEAAIEAGTKPASASMFAAGREKFRLLEAGDPACRARWQKFRDLSLAYFKRVYAMMDVTFDHYRGESEYEAALAATVQWVQDAGVTEVSEGALIVAFPGEADLAPGIILKRDGATTYLTRDLAAIRERLSAYDPAKVIYVVGAPQRDHFRQLFGVLGRMGIDVASRCHHVAFGHVHGLSTREGNVIFLEEGFATAIERVAKEIAAKNPDLPNAAEVARVVGVGAVIYADMRAARIKDVDFDWDEVTRFNGETGPYVMYTHARCCSILRKLGRPVPPSVDTALLDTPLDLALVRELAGFPDELARAEAELEPSVVARYLARVSSACSTYLQSDQHSVIHAPDRALSDARAALVDATRTVLAIGLAILGIAAPEAM